MNRLNFALRRALNVLLPITLVTTALVFQPSVARADSGFMVGLNPISLVADKLGNIYVANSGSGTISKIGAQGSSTLVDLSPQRPRTLAIDAQNRLFVATRTGLILQVASDGNVSNFATVGKNPGALIFDSYGNLYSANTLNNSISKIAPDGTTTIFATVGSAPSSLVFDSLGNLYATNSLDGTVSKVTTAGVTTSEFAYVGARPTGIVVDNSNNLYVSNGDDNTISKIT